MHDIGTAFPSPPTFHSCSVGRPPPSYPLLPSAIPLLEWNIPGCSQIVNVELDRLSKHLAAMRARLLDLLLEAGLGEGVKVHGPRDPSLRLPNTLSIGIPGVEARVLLERVSGNSGGVKNCCLFV